MSDQDYSAQEKAALVAWHLAHGEPLQTRDVSKLTGLAMDGAWRLMQHLARVIPIYQDDRGFWCACAMLELEFSSI